MEYETWHPAYLGDDWHCCECQVRPAVSYSVTSTGMVALDKHLDPLCIYCAQAHGYHPVFNVERSTVPPAPARPRRHPDSLPTTEELSGSIPDLTD